MPAQLSPTSPRVMSLGDVTRDIFFQYSVTVTFSAAGTDTFTPVIQIQNDADFICVQTMYSNSAEIGNAVATTATPFLRVLHGGALVQFTDGSTQRFLQNIQVPLSSVAGNAWEPYIWPFTHKFRAGGFIGLNITGVGAVMNSANLRITFGGFKVPVSG